MSLAVFRVVVVLVLQALDGSLSRFPIGFYTYSGCLNRVRDVAVEKLTNDRAGKPNRVRGDEIVAVICESEGEPLCLTRQHGNEIGALKSERWES